MKTVKFFISSTFKDMNAERDVLIRHVFPHLREKMEPSGIRLQEIDLRWGVTEEEAKKGEVLDLCLDGIEECKPYFIGLLGKRYGWIPAPAFITREEFRSAAEGSALCEEDLELLKRSYHPDQSDERLYALDTAIPNASKDKVQKILENAGVREASMSITEREVDYVLTAGNLPRSIMNLDGLLDKSVSEGRISAEDIAFLLEYYFRAGAEALWRLKPGIFEDERARLGNILGRMDYKKEYHCFFFERKETGEGFYEVGEGPAVDGDYIETDTKRKNQLDELKAKVRNAAAVKSHYYEYPCRWDTRNAGGEQSGKYPVTGLEAFEELLYSSLLVHLTNNPELKATEAEGKSLLDKEHEAQIGFMESRAYNFRGRLDLLDKIDDAVEKALNGNLFANGEKTSTVILAGESGSGKSALLSEFYKRLAKKHDDYLIIPRFIGGGGRRTTNPETILSDLCDILVKEFNISQPRALTGANLSKTFTEYLGKANKEVVIILDALDQLQEEGRARSMGWLPAELSRNVCVVASLVVENGISPILGALRDKSAPPFEIAVNKLTESEKSEIIISYLRQFNKKLKGELVQAIADKEDAGRPLYLQTALEELRLVSRHEELEPFIMSRLPGTTVGMFNFILDRCEEQLQRRLGKNIFGAFVAYMAAGRHGMREEDLRLLLGDWANGGTPDKADARISDYFWGELRRAVRPYLVQRDEEWDFFHMQLKQAVYDRYLQGGKLLPRYNAEIAKYLESRGYGHTTALHELIYQLVMASREGEAASNWDKVEKTLLDFRFMEAKIRAGLETDLENDFRLVMERCPANAHPIERIRLYFDCLRQEAGNLEQFNKMKQDCTLHDYLRQQFTNRIYCNTKGKTTILASGASTGNIIRHVTPARETAYVRRIKTGTERLAAGRARFSPTGDMIAVTNGGRHILYLDIETGTEIGRCECGGKALGFDFLPDNRKIAVIGLNENGTGKWFLQVLNTESNISVAYREFDLGSYAGYFVPNIVAGPDGRIIASIGTNGMIQVFDPATLEKVREWKAFENSVVYAMAEDKGRRFIAAGEFHDKDEGALIRIWDACDYRLLTQITGPKYGITALAFTDDGSILLSGSMHLNNGVVGWMWQLPEGPYDRILLSPAERAGYSEMSAQNPAIRAGRVVFTLETVDSVRSIAVFPGEFCMLACEGSENNTSDTINIVDFFKNKRGDIPKISGFAGCPLSVDVHPQAKCFATLHVNGELVIWPGELRNTLSPIRISSPLKNHSADGRLKYVLSIEDEDIRKLIITETTYGSVANKKVIPCHTAALSPDGKHYARIYWERPPMNFLGSGAGRNQVDGWYRSFVASTNVCVYYATLDLNEKEGASPDFSEVETGPEKDGLVWKLKPGLAPGKIAFSDDGMKLAVLFKDSQGEKYLFRYAVDSDKVEFIKTDSRALEVQFKSGTRDLVLSVKDDRIASIILRDNGNTVSIYWSTNGTAADLPGGKPASGGSKRLIDSTWGASYVTSLKSPDEIAFHSIREGKDASGQTMLLLQEDVVYKHHLQIQAYALSKNRRYLFISDSLPSLCSVDMKTLKIIAWRPLEQLCGALFYDNAGKRLMAIGDKPDPYGLNYSVMALDFIPDEVVAGPETPTDKTIEDRPEKNENTRNQVNTEGNLATAVKASVPLITGSVMLFYDSGDIQSCESCIGEICGYGRIDERGRPLSYSCLIVAPGSEALFDRVYKSACDRFKISAGTVTVIHAAGSFDALLDAVWKWIKVNGLSTVMFSCSDNPGATPESRYFEKASSMKEAFLTEVIPCVNTRGPILGFSGGKKILKSQAELSAAKYIPTREDMVATGVCYLNLKAADALPTAEKETCKRGVIRALRQAFDKIQIKSTWFGGKKKVSVGEIYQDLICEISKLTGIRGIPSDARRTREGRGKI